MELYPLSLHLMYTLIKRFRCNSNSILRHEICPHHFSFLSTWNNQRPILTNQQRFTNYRRPFHFDQRTLFYVGMFIGGSGIYYVTHLERVPISGRLRFMDVSPKLETMVASQAYNSIINQYHHKFLPANHPTVKIVKRIARKIIQAANIDEAGWEFHVIDSKEMNAFVLPGGKVFVFTGILSICQNEDGLAAILGHEIAHQVARHSAEKLSYTKIMFAVQLLGSTVFDISGSMSRMITDLGILLPFSRKMENEADAIGLTLMAQACYNPTESIALWQRMDRANRFGPPEFLSTHPAHNSRIAKIEQLLPAVMDQFNNRDCQHTAGFFRDMVSVIPSVRW